MTLSPLRKTSISFLNNSFASPAAGWNAIDLSDPEINAILK